MAPKIKRISAKTVGEAVGHILPYLEDTTSSTRYNNIYYDGFPGLGNSAVLKCIAQEPPPTLMKKFGKIVHVDCSRWKSRRELQRTIAQQVQLPQGVMDIFDGKDEEDDFRGLDESSRAEIGDVSREILLSLLDNNKCLVVFHNGCNDIVELNDFGIPPAWFGTKVLWTGTGKPWRDPFPYIDSYEKLDASHLYINNSLSNVDEWKCLLQEEAREIARHTCKLGVTSEIAMECCLYLLSMMKHGYSRKMDWDIHASNYLVCDGVIPLPAGCQFDDQAWEVAAALHQYMGIQKAEMGVTRHDALMTSQKRWICSIIHYTTTTMEANVTVPQEATSFLFVKPYLPLATLPNNGMFHQSAIMLRVFRLYGCTFSFSSPPFHCCRGLRFLGLRLCMDQPQGIDEEKDRVQKEVGFFQSLWVVDTRKTDWAPPEITEEMDTNIREIHIKKARFWLHNFPWGQLHNLRKLRVIKPANPLEMHVLPRLPRLKTLILYGCVGLENVTGLPPSLETFSFSVRHDAGRRDAAKITRISMPGCARMVDFTLRGSLPNLKQLNLSGTSIKTLDLSDHVVQAPRLERVILSGCHKLCAVLWPKEGTPCLSELYIDTRGGGGEAGISFPDSDKLTYLQAYVGIMDMRFIQSLVQRTEEPRTVHSYGDRLVLLPSCSGFSWNKDTIKLNLCLSATRAGGPSYEAGPNYEYYRKQIRAALMRRHWDKQRPQLQAPRCHVDVVVDTVPKSLIPNNPFCRAYPDVITNDIAVDYSNYSSAPQLQPSRCHVDIGEGTINRTDAESVHAINAIIFLMNNAESLHVHDNSSITTVITEQMMSLAEEQLEWRHLKQCRVERCPKMHTVFATSYDIARFHELESLCAVDLSVAQCIWSKGMSTSENICSFAKLQSIHVYSCPKLTFVLPLSWSYNFTSLETIHIVSCGELRQVFPVEADYSRDHPKGVLKFPNLKHIYLHELNKLQHICEAKMFAPKLESIRLRGCWGLRRLPSVVQGSRPVVDCEKDWWERLEWDGLEAGHDPSLFEPRHSLYYKMPLPRVSVLR